jgi:hypothetical protein
LWSCRGLVPVTCLILVDQIFEGERAFAAEHKMSTLGIVEAVEVFKQGHFRPSRCLQSVAPDQLSFESFEEVSITSLS